MNHSKKTSNLHTQKNQPLVDITQPAVDIYLTLPPQSEATPCTPQLLCTSTRPLLTPPASLKFAAWHKTSAAHSSCPNLSRKNATRPARSIQTAEGTRHEQVQTRQPYPDPAQGPGKPNRNLQPLAACRSSA